MVSGLLALNWLKDLFSIYTTTRVVRIKSNCLATLHVTLLVLVWFSYLKSCNFDIRVIYQEKCPVRGDFHFLIKGILTTADVSVDELNVSNPELYIKVWDHHDIVAEFPGGFFVLTNLVITPNQIPGACPEESVSTEHVPNVCKNDSECPPGTANRRGTGVYNGTCSTTTGTCMLLGWCPDERDILPFKGKKALLEDTSNFTVFIRNTIEFPAFGTTPVCDDSTTECKKTEYSGRNILENLTEAYIQACIYDLTQNPFCPNFRLGDIVRLSGSNYSEVAVTGGMFRIRVTWQCDFDWGATIRECLPKYSFHRLDGSESNVSTGFYYRSVVRHDETRRTLRKNYGLDIVLEVTGEGTKFDFSLLIVMIGASVGLFGLASLICDSMFDLFCFMGSWGGCFGKCFGVYNEEIRYQRNSEAPSSVQNAVATIAQSGIMDKRSNMFHDNPKLGSHVIAW